ncbi:3',5'-cyclic adenosine monophosphate phosphodiesterase CpdA [Leifsonia bigeumensis]|uniref:3',5'-cyclic adenosine monophosphate phosphodiesterase CpdA n=1 Tax=Leifsonella bigeumensis TaxID=433643 RepID=A0ABP7FS78_9MICO
MPLRTAQSRTAQFRTAEYPRPNHTILHLSDTRLLAGPASGRLLFDRVDPEARLRRLIERLEASGTRPEAIVFTGDLSELGEPDAYATLRSIVDPVAERLGAVPIWVPGERDSREAFRTGLLGQLPSDAPIHRVVFLDGLRVITLDTSVPGSHHGELDPGQLDWLSAELATPAPYGTILAMHHPPVPSLVDLDVAVELRDQSALARVLGGSDVRGIIAGHVHFSTTATFAGIPVSVASATCYGQDLTAPLGSQRARDGGQSYNLVSVFDETVMHTVVPVIDDPIVSWISADESARLLELEEVVIEESAVAMARREESRQQQPLVWDVAGP